MPEVAAAVVRALDGARLPALVVSERPLDLGDLDATVIAPGEAKPDEHFRTVLLAAADPDDLRRTVRRLPALGWARMVAVVLVDTDRAITLRPDPAWPALAAVGADLEHTRLEFTERLPALPVLAALARGATQPAPGRWDGHGGLRVAPTGAAHDDPAVKHPPDVVVDPPAPPAPPPVVSEATGRRPVTVTARDLPDVVDEAVYSPIGFRRDWTRAVVDLDPATRLSPSLVRDLRDAQGVRLAPGHDQRLAAGLAMSGVPLLGLGEGPGTEASLDDALRREELSVRQRRAALTRHSVLAARSDLAATARVRAAAHPSVSILLPTRRPDRLAHALGQVARQRRTLPGAEVELVLVAHGFTPDRDLVDAATELGGIPTTIVTATTDNPPDPSPDALLRAAADAASGDVVVSWDDGDWFGPDVVTDLLLARRYSGADVVGTAAELVHLDAVDTTVRLDTRSETYGAPAGDGPLLLERALLRDLGGRGDPGAVVRDGGTGYTTHGLGHLRRDAHTQQLPDEGRLLARWDGVRPSDLLELG